MKAVGLVLRHDGNYILPAPNRPPTCCPLPIIYELTSFPSLLTSLPFSPRLVRFPWNILRSFKKCKFLQFAFFDSVLITSRSFGGSVQRVSGVLATRLQGSSQQNSRNRSKSWTGLKVWGLRVSTSDFKCIYQQFSGLHATGFQELAAMDIREEGGNRYSQEAWESGCGFLSWSWKKKCVDKEWVLVRVHGVHWRHGEGYLKTHWEQNGKTYATRTSNTSYWEIAGVIWNSWNGIREDTESRFRGIATKNRPETEFEKFFFFDNLLVGRIDDLILYTFFFFFLGGEDTRNPL